MSPLSHLSPRLRGILCVLCSVVIWSGWMVVSRHSVHGSLTAFDVTALRFGVSGILLLPFFLRTGCRIGPWGGCGGLLLAALMGAPYSMIVIFGMRYAPASHAAAITNTSMLIATTLGGILLLRERTSLLRLGGVGLSVLGIGCLLRAHGAEGDASMLPGHLLFILGGLVWSAYVLLAKAWKVEPMQATANVCVLSCLIYLPLYLGFIPSHIGQGNWGEVAFQAFYQGIVTAIVAFLCYNRGVLLLGAAVGSAFLPLVPILATLLAIPALGEIPSGQEWLGIGIAAVGVLFSIGIMDRLVGRSAPEAR